MVSHETVVVEDLDPTKDALVYQVCRFVSRGALSLSLSLSLSLLWIVGYYY